MPDSSPIDGIRVELKGGRVRLEVAGSEWSGGPEDLERLLTHLHYVLGRMRPGTTIVSAFVNGTLWGGKTVQPDAVLAVEDVEGMLDQLSALTPRLAEEARRSAG